MFDVETNVVFFKILKFWVNFERKFFILKLKYLKFWTIFEKKIF